MQGAEKHSPDLATCRDCNARSAGICAVLTKAELSRLATSARRSWHGPGDLLLHEKTENTGYANVTDGIVKLSRLLSDGRQQVVGLQFAPDLLGRLFAKENPLTAEAASRVTLCRVPKAVLEGLVEGNADLKQRLLQQSLQDLDDARDWIVTLGRKDARQRVASLILLIARRSAPPEAVGAGACVVFELPLSRGDMADFLGITGETVSRQISNLRHDGVIRVLNHRSVTVPDLSRLAACAG